MCSFPSADVCLGGLRQAWGELCTVHHGITLDMKMPVSAASEALLVACDTPSWPHTGPAQVALSEYLLT